MKSSKISLRPFLISIFSVLVITACNGQTPTPPLPTLTRDQIVPPNKMSPEQDAWPPIPAPGWSQPVPLGAPINTAGGEDSPFITPDGNMLYFFFTPNTSLPAEDQVGDGFTGIWLSTRSGGKWSEPQRILLAEPGEPHLDGCPFVMDDWMAFCSARAGNHREIDIYTAERQNGRWTHVQNWGELINQAYQVGELHIAADGTLYFASDHPGGMGGLDLWVAPWNGDAWEAPINLGSPINTPDDENRPFISADEQELWFDSISQKGYPGPAIFRSRRRPDGSWGPPDEIISSFAGEPTLTGDGNTLYFVHAYFSEDLSKIIEFDIYVSYRSDTDD